MRQERILMGVFFVVGIIIGLCLAPSRMHKDDRYREHDRGLDYTRPMLPSDQGLIPPPSDVAPPVENSTPDTGAIDDSARRNSMPSSTPTPTPAPTPVPGSSESSDNNQQPVAPPPTVPPMPVPMPQ